MTKSKKIIISVTAVVAAVMVIVILAFSVLAVTNMAVVFGGNDIVEDFGEEKYDCILVLGAGLRSDGSPSDMLADRLDVAIELYQQGISETIILSGDRNVAEDYDEVTAMENYCIAFGVPKSAIVRDEKGFSTYESVLNLKALKEYKRVVVVTQKYHLYRALYIAEEMELEAVGADAATRRYRGQLYRDLREVAARTKDFFLVAMD